MSKFIATDCYVSVDGHDISNWCFRVSTPSTRERVETTGFNSAGTKEFLSGDKEDSIELSIRQDFASGGPHDILADIYQNQSTVAVVVKPTSAATSSTNPALAGNAQLLTYTGLDAEVGNVAEITATLVPADQNGFTWGTT